MTKTNNLFYVQCLQAYFKVLEFLVDSKGCIKNTIQGAIIRSYQCYSHAISRLIVAFNSLTTRDENS